MQKTKWVGIDLARIAKQQFPTLKDVPNNLLVERIFGAMSGLIPAEQRMKNRDAGSEKRKPVNDPYFEFFDKLKKAVDNNDLEGVRELLDGEIPTKDEKKRDWLAYLPFVTAIRNERLDIAELIYERIDFSDNEGRSELFKGIGRFLGTTDPNNFQEMLGNDFDQQDLKEKELALRKIFVWSENEKEKQDALEKLAQMVNQLSEPLTLEYVACFSSDLQARQAALTKIGNDEAHLRGVFIHSRHEDTKQAAFDKLVQLVDQLKEPLTLEYIACFATGPQARQIAVEKISDEDTLKYIVKFSHFEDAKEAATERIGHLRMEKEESNRQRMLNEDLLQAARENKTEEVAKLLSEGAEVNARDVEGRTSLIWASKNGNYEMAELLRDAKADPNAQDNMGYSALMEAANIGNIKLMKLLRKMKANPLLRDKDANRLASDFARFRGHKKAVQLLEKYEKQAQDGNSTSIKRWFRNALLSIAMISGVSGGGLIGGGIGLFGINDTLAYQVRANAPAIRVFSDALNLKNKHGQSYAVEMLHYAAKFNPRNPALLDSIPALLKLIDSKKYFYDTTLFQLEYATETLAHIAIHNLDSKQVKKMIQHILNEIGNEFKVRREAYARIMLKILEEEPNLLLRDIPQLKQQLQSRDKKIREQAGGNLDKIADVYYYCGNYLEWAGVGEDTSEDTRRLTEAIDYYKVTLQIRPTDFYTAIAIGRCYLRIGKHGESLAYLKKAFKLDAKKFSNIKQSYYMVGKNYQNLGQYKKAIAAFETYIRLFKDPLGTYEDIGDCYLKMGKKESAIAAYKKDIKEMEEYPVHYSEYIEALQRKIKNL